MTDAASEKKLAAGDTPDFKWYIVHVLSGFENRVLKTLKERIVNHNMTEYFAEIMVPEENVVANVNGKKRTMKKKFFPGYVLIKMIMSEKTWHLVKDTDKITGFIGIFLKVIQLRLSKGHLLHSLEQLKQFLTKVRSKYRFQFLVDQHQ